MVEILDRIYEVFAQLEKAKEDQDVFKIEEKERELDLLRSDLAKASKHRGSYSTNYQVSTSK
jgi:hypothetical protein